jgi:hypothetical protein
MVFGSIKGPLDIAAIILKAPWSFLGQEENLQVEEYNLFRCAGGLSGHCGADPGHSAARVPPLYLAS